MRTVTPRAALDDWRPSPSPSPEGRRSQPRFAAVVTAALFVVVCLIVTVAVAAVAGSRDHEQRLIEADEAALAAAALEDRMGAYSELLYGARGLTADGEVSFREFHQAVAGLDVGERLPGVQVIGRAEVVGASDLPRWEELVRREAMAAGLGYPELEVHPRPRGGDALVISRIEPATGNGAAFGLDFFSEASRRDAALRARDSGRPAATAPIRLVQETATQQAFLLMLPTYRAEAPTATVEERRSAFTGVVYAAFRTGDLVDAVYGARREQVAGIVDVAAGEPLLDARPGLGDRTRDEEVLVGGRVWQVTFSLAPASTSVAGWAPLFLAIGGSTILVLLLVLRRMWVTSRRRAVHLAEAMVEELHALTGAASEAIVTIDAAGTILTWNRGATEIFGGDAGQVVGASLERLARPGDRPAMRELLDRIIGGDVDVRTWRTVACRLDGTEFPAELSISRWEARGEVFVTGFVRDHTDLERAEAAHEATAGLLSAVLAAATEVSVIATDTTGTITVFNGGAERLLGYAASDLVGRATPEVLHDRGEVVARARELGIDPGFGVFVQAAMAGRPETRTWTYRCADGGRIPVELTVTAMRDRNDVLVGFIGVASDITDRLARERAQLAALERERALVDELTRQAQTTSDFMSTVSHELRTPLTSVRGAAELLADHLSGDEGVTTLVDVIDRNVGRVLGLVDDLLTLARMESSAFQLRNVPCSIADVVDAVVADIEPIAHKRGIRVTACVEGLPVVEGDQAQLERALLNLLSNAVKFSPEHGVVSVRAHADGDDIEIEVEDHGIGIPVEEQAQLFTRFFRSNAAEHRAVDGTGLGLAIVANVVDLHGGSVSLRSIEHEGTTVTIRLPTSEALRPARDRESVP